MKRFLSLLLCILLLIPSTITFGDVSSTASFTQGSGYPGSSGNAGTWDYCSADAYAFFITDEQWIDSPSSLQVSDASMTATLYQQLSNHVMNKIPKWGTDTNYVYVLPTFQTDTGSSTFAQLSSVNSAVEVSGDYSTLIPTNSSDRVWHIGSRTDTMNPDWDGRTNLANIYKSKGRLDRADWQGNMDESKARLIMSYLVSGGYDQYKVRTANFIYANWQDSWGNATEKTAWQIASYIDLLSAVWWMSGSYSDAYANIIDSFFDPDKKTRMPLLIADRAFGFPNSGVVMDGLDLYQHGVGMTGGVYNNLRDGYTSESCNWDMQTLCNKVLANLDSQNPYRTIPLRDGGGNNIDGYGSTWSLYGCHNYSDSTDFPYLDSSHTLIRGLSAWNYLGFNVTFCNSVGTSNFTGRQDISTDAPDTVTLPKGTAKIGQDTYLTFEVDQSKSDPSVLQSFDTLSQELIKQGLTPEWQLGVNIKRSKGTDNKAGADSSTIESFNESQIYNIQNSDYGDPIAWYNNSFTTTNYEEFKQTLTGQKTFRFSDTTKDDAISGDTTYYYYSSAYIRIKIGTNPDGSNKFYQNTASDGSLKTDDNGWYKLSDEDGLAKKTYKLNTNAFSYTSTPESYSEIKQGEPKSEDFEAMSGTPTTRPLYFASGGSEFAVTIDATPATGTFIRHYKLSYPSWSYSYTYTGKDGKEHTRTYTVPAQTDKWTQQINYNYMKINSVKVWKVKTSAVTGMKSLSPMNSDSNGDIVAQIVNGDTAGNDPYVSILTDTTTGDGGSSNAGSYAGGRLRFSEQPQTADPSYYLANQGAADGTYGEDGHSKSERGPIKSNRLKNTAIIKNRVNDVYVQSDSVILHTKSGDMVLYYSENSGHSNNLTDSISCTATPDTLWWNNPLSPAKWSATEINTVWYNGQYTNPNSCFDPKISPMTFSSNMFTPMNMRYFDSGYDYPLKDISDVNYQTEHIIPKPTTSSFNDYTVNSRFNTALASVPNMQKNYNAENVECTAHTATGEFSIWRQFNPLLTYRNGKYDIGSSSVLYERILNYKDPASAEIMSTYDSGYYDRYSSGKSLANEAKYNYEAGKKYFVSHSAYSANKKDCNDIVIYNPVSAEDSKILSLPSSRDQRIDSSRSIAANSVTENTENINSTTVIPNPAYHNNLVFNGFTDADKQSDGTLGWADTQGHPLGWFVSTSDSSYLNYTVGVNATKGIDIKGDGSGTVYCYQDIMANAGDSYTLSYKTKNISATKVPKVELQYLDSAGTIVTSATANKVRVLISQPMSGEALVYDVQVYNTSKAGFTPNNIPIYDYTTVNVENTSQSAGIVIDMKYHYFFRDISDGSLVDSSTMLGDEVLGSQLNPNTGYTVKATDSYKFESYYIAYNDTTVDSLTTSLAKVQGLYSGVPLANIGDNTNEVVAKVYRYSNSAQVFTAPESGVYYIEAFGGNGGNTLDSEHNIANFGGQGSYVNGAKYLNKNDMLIINVGGRGKDSNVPKELLAGKLADPATNPTDLVLEGGYNGGGISGAAAGSGGGCTDIRNYSSTSTIADIKMVAGGGAGAGDIAGKNATATKTLDTSHQLHYGYTALTVSDINNPNIVNVTYDTNNPTVLTYGGGGAGFRGGYAGNNTGTPGQAEGGDSFVDTTFFSTTLSNKPTAMPRAPEGNGKVQITYVSHLKNVTDSATQQVRILSLHQYNNSAPSNAFIEKTNSTGSNSQIVVSGSSARLNTFLNIDYGFSIFFPNIGDFEQDASMLGIKEVTTTRGKGYTDNMDTTEWTYAKYVIFPFKVLYNGVRYSENQKIYLDVNKEYFDFYLPLGNHEFSAAAVKFGSLAVNASGLNLKGDANLPDLYKDASACSAGTSITKARLHPIADIYKTPQDDSSNLAYILDGEDHENHDGSYKKPHTGDCTFTTNGDNQQNGDCYLFKKYEKGTPSLDNTLVNNTKRQSGDIKAKQSALLTYLTDVVGRIGNYTIEDVGDPRFANFFKKSDGTGNFIIPGVAPTVDESKQNFIVGDITDIRGVDETAVSPANFNMGSSQNTLSQSYRSAPLKTFWMNSMGETDRPTAGPDILGQTTFKSSQVLGTLVDGHAAFSNIYGRKESPASQLLGLRDTSLGQLPYEDTMSDNSSFPLSSAYNNIKSLRDQPMRIGYPVFQDIQTLGDYGNGKVMVNMSYYALDTQSDPNNPTIIPVDVYMNVNNSYLPINYFGGANIQTGDVLMPNGSTVPGPTISTVTSDKSLVGSYILNQKGEIYTDKSGNKLTYRYIYDNKQYLDWDNENTRRNCKIGSSQKQSEDGLNAYSDAYSIGAGGSLLFDSTADREWVNSKEIQGRTSDVLPYGMYYAIGNSQALNLNSRCRTYSGESFTYGSEINRIKSGTRSGTSSMDYDPYIFIKQGQRWHFTTQLPSSAVFVKAGTACNTLNIKTLRQDRYLLLTSVDIKAVGSLWALQASNKNTVANVVINDVTKKFNISSINTGRVINVSSMSKSAKDDRNITGTH